MHLRYTRKTSHIQTWIYHLATFSHVYCHFPLHIIFFLFFFLIRHISMFHWVCSAHCAIRKWHTHSVYLCGVFFSARSLYFLIIFHLDTVVWAHEQQYTHENDFWGKKTNPIDRISLFPNLCDIFSCSFMKKFLFGDVDVVV